MKTKLFFLLTFYSIVSFAQTNLANNGNLENWTNATTLDSWTIENEVTQNTTETAEGLSSASFLIRDNTLCPKILTQVSLTNGIEYTISYKFKYISSNYNGAHPITMKIIRSGSATTITSSSFASNNNWVSKSINFTPDQTGDYDLSFSTATFDGESFEVLMDDIKVFDPLSASITDTNIKGNFKIYPTITEGKIYFEQIALERNYNISIFDINGIKYNVKIQNNSIDLSFLKSGMYFVNYLSDKRNIIEKIIKK